MAQSSSDRAIAAGRAALAAPIQAGSQAARNLAPKPFTNTAAVPAATQALSRSSGGSSSSSSSSGGGIGSLSSVKATPSSALGSSGNPYGSNQAVGSGYKPTVSTTPSAVIAPKKKSFFDTIGGAVSDFGHNVAGGAGIVGNAIGGGLNALKNTLSPSTAQASTGLDYSGSDARTAALQRSLAPTQTQAQKDVAFYNSQSSQPGYSTPTGGNTLKATTTPAGDAYIASKYGNGNPIGQDSSANFSNINSPSAIAKTAGNVAGGMGSMAKDFGSNVAGGAKIAGNSIAGGFGALTRALGGSPGSNYAGNSLGTPTGSPWTSPNSGTSTPPPTSTAISTPSPYAGVTNTTVGNRPGTETSTYYNASNIPKGSNFDSTNTPSSASTIVDNAKATREATMSSIQSIVTELTAQRDAQVKAAEDAAANPDAGYDPESEKNIQAISAQLDAAQKQLEDASRLSPEEEAAQKQLDDEQAALGLGLVDVAGQPIPLSFITGQQKALESRSLARTQPLQSQLARLAARRASALDVAKSSLSAIKDKKSGLVSSYDTRYKRKNEVTDAATKRSQDVADQVAKDRYKTISDGASLYDTVAGKNVAENVKNVTPKSTALTTRTVNTGGRQLLINSKTGEVIKDLGPSNVKGGNSSQTP